MGLDSVEFILAVEDAFGLAIPGPEASLLTTPGKLVDYLEGRLQPGHQPANLEQRAFHILRRAGIATLHQPRRAFAPTTEWDELLPPDRLRGWELLGRATKVTPWPRRTSWYWRRKHRTVGDTATMLASLVPQALLAPGEGWTRQRIEQVVTQVMRSELGIHRFAWTDHFVHDLHVA
jgi:hypothetical protein